MKNDAATGAARGRRNNTRQQITPSYVFTVGWSQSKEPSQTPSRHRRSAAPPQMLLYTLALGPTAACNHQRKHVTDADGRCQDIGDSYETLQAGIYSSSF